MANDTIASGGTLTLTNTLTSGSSIDFLNDVDASGTLILKPPAFAIATVDSNGTITATTTIGAELINFQPGDLISLQNIATLYSKLDFASDASAENASFANQITFAAESGVQFYISADGDVATSPDTPFTLDANSQTIIDEISTGLFGSLSPNVILTMSFAMRTNPNSNHPFIDAVVSADSTVNPCFAAGTRILTAAGEIAVEQLALGDRLLTRDGEEAPIIWIGRRLIDTARHPRPACVRPIIIEPDALADGVPSRRLRLSPDHALLIDDLLVPAKDLVNHGSIRQEPAGRVVYYHIELAAHAIIFAEGAPAESYLDTGHRGVFDNVDQPLLLHPDLAQHRRETEGCAPLCMGGEALAMIRHRLALRRTRSPAQQPSTVLARPA